jgi:hypothetical protein
VSSIELLDPIPLAVSCSLRNLLIPADPSIQRNAADLFVLIEGSLSWVIAHQHFEPLKFLKLAMEIP